MASRRRVLHVCPYMHPTAGGPPVVVDRLATHSELFGWDASVLTTSLMCDDDGSALSAELRQRLDIEVLPVDRPRIMGHVSQATAAMERAIQNADVVHVHTLWHSLNTIARHICRRHSKPYVLSPHGMLDPFSLSVHALRKRLYFALVERYNLRGAARIVFTSRAECELAMPVVERATKYEIIPLGADRPPAIPRKQMAAHFLKTYPGGVDGGRILFLSRLHPKKNLESLFAAMRSVITSHPDAHLFVAGSGQPSYEQILRRTVAKLGLASKITFTGFLSGKAKWSALAAADVFILTSHQENFGVAVAEAMHAGLSVVIGQGINISPQIREANAGIVLRDALDVQETANSIRRLLGDANERHRISRNAVNLATQNYCWKTNSGFYFSLYDRLLNASLLNKY